MLKLMMNHSYLSCFCYLGSLLSTDCREMLDVESRIKAAIAHLVPWKRVYLPRQVFRFVSKSQFMNSYTGNLILLSWALVFARSYLSKITCISCEMCSYYVSCKFETYENPKDINYWSLKSSWITRYWCLCLCVDNYVG